MNRKIFLFAGLLILATGVVWVARNRPPADPNTIRMSGNIEATTVAASFKIPGRLKERLVDEGQNVVAGQVLAKIDSDDLTFEISSREAEVAAAKASLEELEAGSRKEEIAQADAAVERVKSESERLRLDFARQQELFRKEVIPAREFDRSKSAYEVSLATLREIKEQQKLVHTGPRREKISIGRARLNQAQAVRDLARTRLGYAQIASPLSGVVLAKHIEPGEQVAAGTPVVTVADLGTVWARGYVAESDVGRIKLGQKVKVTNDSFPNKKYDGTITFISPEAEFTPKSVQTQKERVKLVYRIKINIPNPDRELKPGMPVDAEIHVQ